MYRADLDSWPHMQIDAFDTFVSDLFCTPIACVLAGSDGFAARILLDLFQHRRQLLAIVRLLRDVGGNNDLRFPVYSDLRVCNLG
jgi:hypothetical protein